MNDSVPVSASVSVSVSVFKFRRFFSWSQVHSLGVWPITLPLWLIQLYHRLPTKSSLPSNHLLQQNQRFATMSSDSPPGIDEVFLGFCREVSSTLSLRTSVSRTATLASPPPTGYRFGKLDLDEDEDPFVSDVERLSAFYANAAYDFYGTPSCALCVYKNGDAWPVRTGPESWRIIREARGVHGHPMQATWRELGERVYTLLDDKKVRWTSIDPLAFAEAGEMTFSPLLIWIGVERASLPYELANTAAEAVTFFLTEAGFDGFEVGFRESVVTRSVAGPKMLPFNPNDTIPMFRKPFTPALGLSIAPLKTPHFEGTGALYFRESKDSKRVFLLTCAHVARPPPVHSKMGLARKTKSHPREQIIALGTLSYANSLRNMMGNIGFLDCSVSISQGQLSWLGKFQEGESANTTRNRNDHLALVKRSRETIGEFDKFHSEISKRWTIPDHRLIGEVVHVEPIAANVAPHGFTRDWALIELYNDKIDWGTFMGNKVFIGGNLLPVEYSMIMFPRKEDHVNYPYPRGGLLQAVGVVHADEMHNPQQVDANGEKCLLVVKNGGTTGTTIGRVTGMESFTRVYKENGIKETSIEIAVLPYGNRNGPFSARGDSGSIVLDKKGRILGMVTGGAGSTNRTDITYLTPYWYIEEEIKKHFPDSVLYEVVEY